MSKLLLADPAAAVVDATSFELVDLAELRFNWVPALATEGPHLDRLGDLARRLVDREYQLVGLGAALADRLGALAPSLHGGERGALLTLRRDVFNGRAPRRPLPANVALDPDVSVWLASLRARDDLRAEVACEFEAAAACERALLQAACATPEFLLAVSATSRSLYDDVRRYEAARGSTLSKRLLKSEPAILRYLDRARLKTSPFSWYTSIALVELDGEGPPLPELGQLRGAASYVETSHATIRRVVDAVLRHPAVRPLVSYDVARRTDGPPDKLTFEVTVDEPHPRVYGNAERRVSVRRNPALENLVAWLDGRRGAVRWDELCRAVQSWGPSITLEAAAAFLAQLVESGVLRPASSLPEQATDLLERAEAFLDTIPADVARAAARCLADARGALDGVVGEMTLRSSALSTVEAAFAEALAGAGASIPGFATVYENTVVPAPVSLGRCGWDRVVEDAAGVASVMESFDRSHTLRALLRDEFTGEFGHGGVCRDMLRFRDVVGRAMERWGLAIMGRDAIDQTDPLLSSMAAVRRDLVGEYLTCSRSGTEEMVITPERAEVLRDLSSVSWSSYSLFMQPEVGEDGAVRRAVMNHFYNGLGAYVSRFLPAVDDRCTASTRSRLRRLFPADTIVAEIRPTCGFNANLHPLLCDVEIDVDGQTPGAWPLERLRAMHDVESGHVVLVDGESGRRVELLYLGFLIPFLLPSTWAAMYTLASRGPVLDPFAAPAEASRTAEERGAVRSYPRVRLGTVVIERRRWYAPPALVRSAVGESRGAEFLVRLDQWRRELGMPDAVFFRPRSESSRLGDGSIVDQIARQAPWGREKPQYLHFSSPLRVGAFCKWLATATEDVVFEEALPRPTDAPLAGDGGARVGEVVIELDRRPRSVPRG